jgi:hypothetical protein
MGSSDQLAALRLGLVPGRTARGAIRIAAPALAGYGTEDGHRLRGEVVMLHAVVDAEICWRPDAPQSRICLREGKVRTAKAPQVGHDPVVPVKLLVMGPLG